MSWTWEPRPPEPPHHHPHERPHHPPPHHHPGPGPFRAGNGYEPPPHYRTWELLDSLGHGLAAVSRQVEVQDRTIAELRAEVAELSAQLRDALAILRANGQG